MKNENYDLTKRIYPITSYIMLTAVNKQVTDTYIRTEICEILDISLATLCSYEKIEKGNNPRRLRVPERNLKKLNFYFSQNLQKQIIISPQMEIFQTA